ncbi:hypothetical protein [Alkalibaculum bacchi]|nr:hypothetical protein [Alkalibaculum bacchi]
MFWKTKCTVGHINGNYDPTKCIDIDPLCIYDLPDIAEEDFIDSIA